MSKLQEKLRENKNRINRDKFLSELDSEFSTFLANAEISSDLTCIKYAAFPAWDKNNNVRTTTRGKVKNWNNLSFHTWQELIAALGRFQKVKNYIGWFFSDPDGPYYKISINAFLAYLPSISKYGNEHDHFDFGWVGTEDDVGIIIEHNRSHGNRKFEISVWGI